MCCFTGPVRSVSGTSIFARDAGNGRQFLVYSMNYQASGDLAMVLPLPVPPLSPEAAVLFIDLHNYANFFTNLQAGFPKTREEIIEELDRPLSVTSSSLPVIRVGNFDASFVPQIKDFKRIDPRFRLPAGVWDKLSGYKNFGFAVFKLRKESETIHPIAFSFPRTEPGRIFFPTLHIHDGQVHPTAHFDHRIYCQVGTNYSRTSGWRESPQLAASFLRVGQTHGIIDGDAHCYLKRMVGELPNKDTEL